MLYTLKISPWNNFVIGACQGIRDIAAGSYKDSIVTLHQVGEHYITPDSGIIVYFDTEVSHIFGGLFISDRARKSPDRNTIHHYAASDRIGLDDRNWIA